MRGIKKKLNIVFTFAYKHIPPPYMLIRKTATLCLCVCLYVWLSHKSFSSVVWRVSRSISHTVSSRIKQHKNFQKRKQKQKQKRKQTKSRMRNKNNLFCGLISEMCCYHVQVQLSRIINWHNCFFILQLCFYHEIK